MAAGFRTSGGLPGKDERAPRAPRASRAFRCRCARPVFFHNSECLACRTMLGFVPARRTLLPLRPDGDGWRVFGDGEGPRFARCGNFRIAGCNWMIDERDGATLCVACRLNRVIPDQSVESNRIAWRRIERAKRRLVSQLLALGLPVVSRVAGECGADTKHGLAFDFLRAAPGGPRVVTGHAGGIVTLDIDEADDARRERIRTELHEPYRTLLGHLRHEVGHYYWRRLVAATPWLEPFRARFGDERADYAAALRRNYAEGPPAGWAQRHVSAYASCHPLEDWAETWAHYLHMVDTIDTALSFGLDAEELEVDTEPFASDVLEVQDGEFLYFVNAWIELTALLNELSSSMGLPDFYPFVLSVAAIRKLHLIHRVVTEQRARR